MGTIRYTSVNSHLSIEQSRRDDLEALFYILVYMIKGKLPWQGLVVFDDETRMRKIAEMKCSITPEKLTEGLSGKLCAFFKYVKKLKFTDAPDYVFLGKLLTEAAEEKELRLEEHVFEWVTTRSSSSINSVSRSLGGQANSHQDIAALKKSGGAGSSPDDLPPPSKSKTINYLELPYGATPKGESESNTPVQEGFNSKQVKIDSCTNIGSKEELGIIKELDLPKFKSAEKPTKAMSSRETKLIPSSKPTSSDPEDRDKDSSENYSQGAMDENVSSISKKIERATLTTRYNRPKIVNLSTTLIKASNPK